MVEDDPRIRKRASEVLKLGDLRMVEPGIERETEAATSPGPVTPTTHMRKRGHPGVRGTASRDVSWSPTIRAALIAGTPWLDVFCPGVGQSRSPRVRGHPGAGVAVLLVPRGGATSSKLVKEPSALERSEAMSYWEKKGRFEAI
jgi:hypothetical protein